MRRWLARGAFGAALLALAPCGFAQMIPCKGVSDQGLKLLLDEVVSSGAGSEAVMLALLQRVDAGVMQVALESDSKKGARPAAPAKRVRVVRCPQRRPGSPSDFDEATVRELNNNQVVIEVWGYAAPVPAAQGGGHQATVGYALVPIQHWESGDVVRGIVLVPRHAKSLDTVEDLLRVLDQSGRLAAYTAAASGLRLLRERSYDQARTQLCFAQDKLQRLQSESLPDDQVLLGYVSALAQDVVTKAKADAEYVGALKLLATPQCQLNPS